MAAKGAAIAAALIFILICAILPASAGTETGIIWPSRSKAG